MCATKAITLQPASVTVVRNDEEAFTGRVTEIGDRSESAVAQWFSTVPPGLGEPTVVQFDVHVEGRFVHG
jgi:hypothetical protein